MEPVTVQTDAGKVDVKISNRYSLNWQDALQGFIMAVGTPALVIIQQSLDAGTITFNWKVIGMAAAGGGVMYLLKNYFRKTVVVTETK